MTDLFLKDPEDAEYEDKSDIESEEEEQIEEEEDKLSGEGEDEGQVLGNPDMEEDKSTDGNYREVEKDGEFVKEEGAVADEDVEKGVLADRQLVELRAKHSLKFKAMLVRQVRINPVSAKKNVAR